MLTTPSKNIPLNEEQSKQIELFEIRIRQLKDEISASTASLKVYKDDNEKAFKEKKFLEDSITSLQNELLSLKRTKDDEYKLLETARIELKQTSEKIADVNRINDSKNTELKARESDIDLHERVLRDAKERIEERQKELNSETEKLDGFRTILEEAVKKIKW